MYAERSRVETAIGICKDLGLWTPRVRGRVRVKAHVFIALCPRLTVALANHHGGNYVASPTITLREQFCTTDMNISSMVGNRGLTR